ncbi:hypothetical protein BDP81DRAFT_441574 [Colletotrichum phormii]|uniref:Uncharacterized protein n=1 Tax=Colletotrichum phormii TaxID=359342 RepID=A0AAI9ZD92_9PEZI|nr:uncharacterized protein BDP81DRAFT_441574 [Colletotrichum phormii]KAK1622373.1 hypothetical protein BDP81DRAFT_441574 [Colletotrichum phormii]
MSATPASPIPIILSCLLDSEYRSSRSLAISEALSSPATTILQCCSKSHPLGGG